MVWEERIGVKKGWGEVEGISGFCQPYSVKGH